MLCKLESYLEVLSGEPELETQGDRHQVAVLPHPRVADQLVGQRLQTSKPNVNGEGQAELNLYNHSYVVIIWTCCLEHGY